jgi:transcriptional regulator with PAS, ATPase and Fis domain
MEKLRNGNNKKLDCRIEGFSQEVMQLMESYNWPGNIRELENVMEKLLLLTKTGIVGTEMLPFIESCMHREESIDTEKTQHTISMMEIETIQAALQRNNGNKTHAAQQLGIDRTTLIRKIKLYNL